MKPLRRRPAVEKDITRYSLHIAADNPQAAERFLETVETSLRRLAQFPNLGRIRRWKTPGLAGVRMRPLSRPFDTWQIIYREASDAVEILRVLHGALDLETRITQAPE